MTPEEFRAELAGLGVTQTWLADRLRVKRQVVSRWATKASPVPSWMPFLLELLRDTAEQQQEIAFLRLSTERLLDCDLVATHDDIRERLDAMQAQEDARETRHNGKSRRVRLTR